MRFSIRWLLYSLLCLPYVFFIGFAQSLITLSIGLGMGIEDKATAKVVFWLSAVPTLLVVYALHRCVSRPILTRLSSCLAKHLGKWAIENDEGRAKGET